MSEGGLKRGPMLALFLTVFVSMTGFGIVIPVTPFFGLHLGASATEITYTLGAYSLGQLIASPLWGRLADRYGRRPILIGTLALTALSYIALAYAQTIHEIGAIRFAAGLAAGNIAAAFAAATDLSTLETRAKAMGVVGAGFGFGFIVGPALGGFLAGADPTQADFARVCWAAAALAGAAALTAWAILPETRPKDAPPQAAGLIAFWKRPALFALIAVTLLTIAAQALMESAFGLWSHAALGWGPPQMGALFGVVGLMSALLQGLGAGALSRRFGEARLLFAALSLYVAGFTVLFFASEAAMTIFGMTLLAAGAGVLGPSLQSLVSREAAPQERGAVVGVQQSASALGRVLGPLAAGPIYDGFGQNAPFALGAALAFAAALIAWRGVRKSSGA
jgi:DHA1 family tetracycline resistance protein-like MFS transporter